MANFKAYHKNLGEVIYSEACQFMQLTNPDPTSIFIEHDGDIKEVSKQLVVFVKEKKYEGK